jgi:SMC interacting uncharacterized protein involved in chromosome segregation
LIHCLIISDTHSISAKATFKPWGVHMLGPPFSRAWSGLLSFCRQIDTILNSIFPFPRLEVNIFCRAQYEKQVQEGCSSDIDNENSERKFFDMLAKSYVAYMSRPSDEPDNLQLEKDLELDFRESFCFLLLVIRFADFRLPEMKHAAVQDEVCRVRKANEKMQQEIEELSNSKLETLQEQRGHLLKDLDKFKLLIDNLHKHQQEVAAKLSEAKVEAASKGIL